MRTGVGAAILCRTSVADTSITGRAGRASSTGGVGASVVKVRVKSRIYLVHSLAIKSLASSLDTTAVSNSRVVGAMVGRIWVLLIAVELVLNLVDDGRHVVGCLKLCDWESCWRVCTGCLILGNCD